MPEIVQKDSLEPPRGPWTPESLQAMFPLIPWREPVRVSVAGIEGGAFCCRTCIANDGLKAEEIAALLSGKDGSRRPRVASFLDRESFDAHMLEHHPPPEDLTLPPPGSMPGSKMPPLRRPPGV